MEHPYGLMFVMGRIRLFSVSYDFHVGLRCGFLLFDAAIFIIRASLNSGRTFSPPASQFRITQAPCS